MNKMGFGKTFLACLLAIFVGSVVSFFLTIFIFVGVVATFASFEEKDYTINDKSILMIDLSEPIIDVTSSNILDNFDIENMKFRSATNLYEAVAMIDEASQDPRIKGIYLKVAPSLPTGLSNLYELREALLRFRQNSDGKFIIAYGDMYSQSAFYLASVADKIYLNPAGAIDWSGMSATLTFYKGTLDKLGITPEIIRHGKFKGAVEPFMLTQMSPENRQQYDQLLAFTWNNLVGDVAKSRSLSVDTLQSLASNLSISTASDALKYGLVDSLLYRDELQANLKRLSGKSDMNLITFNEYRRSGVKLYGDIMSKDKVAIIYAVGDIVDQGNSSEQIVGNELGIKLRSARTDDNIKAVVLRVNSPGGSALASEVIRREVELTRKAKPLVVSMGSYAASGGYWISCSADHIVATPSTLTGSIGVFGLMFNIEKGAKEKLGVTFDVVSTNPSADMGSSVRAMTPMERRVIQNSVDTIYNNFIANVSRGRGMSVGSVDSLGGGRVWSGSQAVGNGLVNTIGGLHDAVILAGEKAGLTKYRIVNAGVSKQNNFISIFNQLSSATFSWVFGADKAILDGAVEIQSLIKDQGIKAVMEQKVVIN